MSKSDQTEILFTKKQSNSIVKSELDCGNGTVRLPGAVMSRSAFTWVV